MNKKQTNITFTINQSPTGAALAKKPAQPPKNNKVITNINVSILPYSPKKNNANVIEL